MNDVTSVVIPIAPIPGIPTAPGLNNTQQAVTQTAPSLRVLRNGPDTAFEIAYNFTNSRSLGTPAAHDFLVTSPQAVNLPASIRVFQNSRNTESRGDLIPVQTAISPNEALTDMVADRAIGEILGAAGSPADLAHTMSTAFAAPLLDLDAVDVVIAGSFGEGFAARMQARGIVVVATELTDPIEAVKE